MLVAYTAEMLENRGDGKTTLRCISGMPSLGKDCVWKCHWVMSAGMLRY